MGVGEGVIRFSGDASSGRLIISKFFGFSGAGEGVVSVGSSVIAGVSLGLGEEGWEGLFFSISFFNSSLVLLAMV